MNEPRETAGETPRTFGPGKRDFGTFKSLKAQIKNGLKLLGLEQKSWRQQPRKFLR